MSLQIEQNLKNDASGIYKDELLAKFNEAASEARAELNQGVKPEEYEKLNSFLRALEVGSEVVEQVWSQR